MLLFSCGGSSPAAASFIHVVGVMRCEHVVAIFLWELAAVFPPQHRLLVAVSFSFQWSPGGELSMELPHVPGAPHVPPGTVPPDEAQVGTGFYVGGLQIRHFDPNPVTPRR
jgi:hypothetical protein